MAYEFYDAEVIKIEDESDLVKRFYFKMPDKIKFEFRAGQFVMLDLPLHSKLNNRTSIRPTPAALPPLLQTTIFLSYV